MRNDDDDDDDDDDSSDDGSGGVYIDKSIVMMSIKMWVIIW